MRYRRKPTEVDAFQLSADAEMIAPDWFTQAVIDEKIEIDRSLLDGAVHVYGCTIRTAAGRVKAKIGDYIIRDGNQIYPCKPKIFAKAYERAG